MRVIYSQTAFYFAINTTGFHILLSSSSSLPPSFFSHSASPATVPSSFSQFPSSLFRFHLLVPPSRRPQIMTPRQLSKILSPRGVSDCGSVRFEWMTRHSGYLIVIRLTSHLPSEQKMLPVPPAVCIILKGTFFGGVGGWGGVTLGQKSVQPRVEGLEDSYKLPSHFYIFSLFEPFY